MIQGYDSIASTFIKSICTGIALIFFIGIVNAQIPTTGLVGYYPFNGNANDGSSYHNNGTISGAILTTNRFGVINRAYQFNGINQYIEIPDANQLSISTTGELSISVWMRCDVLNFPSSENEYVHWMGKGVNGQHEWTLRIYDLNSSTRPNRTSCYVFNLSGGLGSGSYVQESISTGEWIHYVAVYNYPTNSIKLYKNGILKDTDFFSDYSVIPNNGTAPMRVGTRDFGSYFKGGIDDIRIYNRVLTASEITKLYQEVASCTPTAGTDTKVLCAGSSYTFNGITYTTDNTTATKKLTNAAGCDSIVTLNLHFLSAVTGKEKSIICANESITVNGKIYNASKPTGTEIIKGGAANGCDSTVTINLTVLPAVTGTEKSTLCANESITVNGKIYNASKPTGTEVILGGAANGCDSTVTISLNVLPAVKGTENSTICANESITVNGVIYNASKPTGTEVILGGAANGCDTTVTINLNVLPAIDVTTTTSGSIIRAVTSNASYQWLDCNANNALLDRETNQTLTVTSNGTYAVEITTNGCKATSECVIINNILGLSDNSEGMQFVVYPNPTENQFSITFETVLSDVKINIVDIQGKLISSSNYNNTNTIDFEIQHSSGVYLVEIITPKGKQTLRLTKM